MVRAPTLIERTAPLRLLSSKRSVEIGKLKEYRILKLLYLRGHEPLQRKLAFVYSAAVYNLPLCNPSFVRLTDRKTE